MLKNVVMINKISYLLALDLHEYSICCCGLLSVFLCIFIIITECILFLLSSSASTMDLVGTEINYIRPSLLGLKLTLMRAPPLLLSPSSFHTVKNIQQITRIGYLHTDIENLSK
jgi:hypothetical protein